MDIKTYQCLVNKHAKLDNYLICKVHKDIRIHRN